MKKWWIILLGMSLLGACMAPAQTPAVVFPTATSPTLVIPTATKPAVAVPTATMVSDPTLVGNTAGLTADFLKNFFTYSLKSLPDIPVTMKNGQAQFNDPAKNLKAQSMLVEPLAFGDLNGDNMPDAVMDIATNTGGSGTFHELIVVLWQSGKPVQAADYELGDRVAIRGLKIEAGKINLDYLRHGPKDPFCCPSEHALVTLQLKGTTLQVLSDKVVTP